jgi:hypothetical protein
VRSENRQGFGQGGKTAYASVPYRCMLQALILDADGHAFAFMYESENMYDPESDKEDCGLKAFMRLSQCIKVAVQFSFPGHNTE